MHENLEKSNTSNNLYNSKLKKATLDNTNTPRVDSLIKNLEKIDIKNYSIKTNTADTDLLDIFDRSQRTLAATLAVVGDNAYYTPNHRIGYFMQFSSHLKLNDLKIIEKHFGFHENQPAYLQSRRDLSLYTDDPDNMISLFHGFMKYEHLSAIFDKSGSFDPIIYFKKFINDDFYNTDLWPDDYKDLILNSLNNYNKYLNSDKILKSDIAPYNKKSSKSILMNLNHNLIDKYTKILNSFLGEIETEYYITAKNIIMEYILRSPDERKRLNILFYSKKYLPSSYVIAMFGSFNRSMYTSWIQNYSKAHLFLQANLKLCNIILSSVCDWTYSFSHVNLYYISQIENLKKHQSETLHVTQFIKNQNNYLSKMLNFLKDIYYRGVILITTKSKMFKRITDRKSIKWTFKGLVAINSKDDLIKPIITSSSVETEQNVDFYSDNDFGMDYSDKLSDYWSNMQLDKLNDIRINPSYYAYMNIIKRSEIDLSKTEYDNLDVDSKIKINSSVTCHVTLFFRKLLEQSINYLSNYILNFKSNESIFVECNDKNEINNELNYKAKDLKLPLLKSFMIRHQVISIINIKANFDSVYNVVSLEYTYDQICDMFEKLIDTTITIFNNISSSYFLEFKNILPSDYEKNLKSHWTKLNEIFNETSEINFAEDYFSNFCPNLIIEHTNIENNHNQTTLHVADKTQEIFLNIKAKILKHIKTLYIEMEESIKIFVPLKELTNNQIQEAINYFLEGEIILIDYNKFTFFFERLKVFETYISTIPNFVKIHFINLGSLFLICSRYKKREERTS